MIKRGSGKHPAFAKFEKNYKKFQKPLDKRGSLRYNTLGILRQQVPVKALAFLPRCDN